MKPAGREVRDNQVRNHAYDKGRMRGDIRRQRQQVVELVDSAQDLGCVQLALRRVAPA